MPILCCMGALSLTASKIIQKKYYNPLIPGITHIPYAYCYRCPYHMSYPKCDIECVRWVEEGLFRTTMPPEEVAAIFVEPIQKACAAARVPQGTAQSGAEIRDSLCGG